MPKTLPWLLLSLILSGCVWIFDFAGAAKIREAETYIGAELPDSAQNIWIRSEQFFGDRYFIRFEMPPDELPDFVAALGLADKVKPGENPFGAQGNYGAIPWWTVELEDAQGRYAGGYRPALDPEAGENRQYSILVDQRDPNLWTVYLFVFREL
jgi:hypothetical protein